MTIMMRSVLVALAVAMLGGCAGSQLQKAQQAQPPTDDFARGLYTGYIDLSESEYSEGDYWDSDVFAIGAMNASSGEVQGPEEISARDLPEDKVGELTSARNRLVAALDATARTKVPAGAARAQVMFDCWMQEQEENFQPTDIQRCRARFEQAMSEVEAAMAPPVVEAPPPPPPPQEIEEPAQIQRSYIVFFDWDSATITDEANDVISSAVQTAREFNVNEILATGHTDLSGSAAYNLGLSDRRASAVREVMTGMGLSESSVTTLGVGETEPLVSTPDGVREPQNRRVEILLK